MFTLISGVVPVVGSSGSTGVSGSTGISGVSGSGVPPPPFILNKFIAPVESSALKYKLLLPLHQTNSFKSKYFVFALNISNVSAVFIKTCLTFGS